MGVTKVALAEWLRRVPAKYMGFPRESSNLSGDEMLFARSWLIGNSFRSAFNWWQRFLLG